MAESIAVEVLQPVIEATVKSVGATIKRQFNYLCCFTSNIAALKDEAERLDDATKGLQGRVDREIDNVQVIVPEVETWIKRSNHIKDEMNGILNQVPNVGSGCFNLRARFSLSKRAKKTTDRMEELRGQCKFEAISQPGPPPATRTVLLGTTYEFESRKQIEEDIMKSLRDGDVNMIGICGMGGLGKTTMAKKILNRALEKEHLFKEVVLAVVSQPIDKLKIQKDVGGSLGLNLEAENEQSRVQKLHARLSGTKKILLVLDDIWEGFEVEELGIPRDCKGCTILLTSRNHQVLRAMNVEKVFGMEVLTKEDAWFLFREIAGTCVDDTGLHSVANEVVKECGGLPIALSTVGAALKDEMNKDIWIDVLRQLRKSNPSTIPEILKNVYKPLKVSYERLDSKEAKSVFLLCCLFGEDVDVPLDYLTYFCLGLGIFEGNVEEAMNWMCTLTKMLKSRSLLLDIDQEYFLFRYQNVGRYFVRMHDVVRDVCIFIAREEGYIGGDDCTWFSSIHATLRERTKLPMNLRLLYLTGNSKMEEEINFNNSFVEEIRELRVLYIENYSPFTSLPHTTEPLRNLGTLVLDSCWKLKTISFVGELVHLEILICRNCYSIKELPSEMKGLTRLKLLDLSACENLERIGGGIISSLVGLEELKMLGSFSKWEAWDINEESENENARLRELEALTNLRCLEIQIDNTALAAENMRLSSKLERFEIKIPFTNAYSQYRFFSHSSNKKLSLKWEGENCLGDWVEQLLGDAECLYLKGNGANNVDYLEKCQNIRRLELERVRNMKNIGRISMDDATVFPHMEFLKLEYLPQLEEILDGPISSNSYENLNSLRLLNLPGLKQMCENLNSLRLLNLPGLKQMWKSSSTSPVLPKLKEIVLQELPNLATFELPLQGISFIEIAHCGCLRNLGQLLSAQNDYHSQLEYLLIWTCEMMEQVFLWNDNEEKERRITKIMFPKLKEVQLFNLPKLVTFCEGIGGIEFPLLKTLSIEECPKMKSMVSSEENNCEGSSNADVDGYHSPHLFCQQEKVSFGSSLEILKIQWMNAFCCRKIPVSIFNRLELLEINGNNKGSMSLFTLSLALNFVSLRHLRIEDCDEIVEVIKDEEEVMIGGERTLLFPKLEELNLHNLCKLMSFCKGNWYVNCKRVTIDNCSNMKIFNLESHVSFPFNGLEELRISGYEGSMSLFSSSIARNLVSLKQLEIYDCKEMVKVIEDEKEEENVVTTTTILFPKLQVLKLSLEKLESFCELREIWGSPISSNSFQNLKELSLRDLPTLKQLWNNYYDISVFTNLSSIEIRHCPRLRNLGELSIAAHDWLAHLQILSIEECEMMEQVFLWKEEDDQTNIDTTLVFSKLKSLILKSLPRLSNLCEGIESFEFPKLTQIQLKDCPLLKEKVFSMNLFFEPDQVKMDIWNNQPFRNAEYLSLEGNAYTNSDVREVQNMYCLTFRECSRGKKLVNVTTMHTLFPQLEVLRLVKLPELEEIWEIDGTNSFRNLKELRLEFLPSLKHLWPSQVVSIFNKLSCIYIYGCHKLCNLFSLPVTETDSYLLQLEELVIESCDMIEYVFFWNEGENQSNIHIPKLKVLILDSLPKLRSFCKGDTKIEFPLLDRKRISRCPLLENFVSTDWLPDDWSPNDHGHNIHLFCEPDNEVQEKMELKLRGNITLGRNKIQKCVEYMSLEGDHSTSSDFGVGESMRCLTFRECSMGTKLMNMTTIASRFPSIKVLTLRECSMGMKLMNMTTIATPFHLLEVMRLVNITELEEIWDIDGPKNIKELWLKSLPALKHLWRSSSSPSQMNVVSIFSNLSSIYIHGCHELCNLFSLLVTDMGSCVFQLENLVIESCEMMEQVFLWNEEESQRSIIFPKLKVLKLDSLPRLMSFCEGTESFEFPFLVEMRISRCPLQNLISTDDSPIDHDSIHLFCKPDKVSFSSLKVLSTSRNPFCGHEIPASSFNGLVELRIIEYRSCMSLFSSSIARNLLSLRLLDISECEEMVQVIQHEDVEEEKVVNAGDQKTLLFPKLENLALRDLPKLEAFCEWKSDVELPPLIQVVIVRCPKMTNFTSGKDCISKLEILKIEECEMMEEVFLGNEEDKQSDIDTTLVFSQLKSLSLNSLPRLSSLCKGIKSFEFPQLTQIQVKDCPILLQNLVSINLFCKPNKVKMEKLWNSQPLRNAEYLSLEGDSSRNLDFRKVESMRLLTFRECSTWRKLVNMTTMDALFPHLEILRLVKLTELEEIWDIDGSIQSQSFENFKELRLEFLPKLKHLWQGSSNPSEMNIGSIFNKLSSLHVYGCHELCNLFSLAVTETGSCLLQLEELVIESCDRMEHVFFLNEGENQSNIIHIPKLKVLILDSLPKLTCFCEGIESFELPSLVQKRISRCPQLENLDSTDWSPDDIHLFCKSENKKKMELKLQGNITLGRNKIQECVEYYMTSEGDGSRSLDLEVAKNMRCLTFTEFSMGTKLMNMMTIDTVFPLLEVMCLVNITELKEIWDTDGDGPKNLNELRLKSLPALNHLWQIRSRPSQMNVDVIISIFNKLSCIYIYGCHTLCNLFPLSMMERDSCLSQLERLEIENCEMMEQVFLWNEENIHVEKFPELKHLSLSFLPKLRNICKGIEHIQCPKLGKMNIINCPLLESLVYWHKDQLPFIFNSLRSSQIERGKGANTALQPHIFKREEKQRKEVEEEQRPTHRRTRTM